MKVKFEQIYGYGDNWEFEIDNLPENSLLCVVTKFSVTEKCQDYMIVIPGEFDPESFFSNPAECCQVGGYSFKGYTFLCMEHVTLLDKPDKLKILSIEELEKNYMQDFFNKTYVSVFRVGGRSEDISKLLDEWDNGENTEELKNKLQEYLQKTRKAIHKIVGIDQHETFKTLQVGVETHYSDIRSYHALESELRFIDISDGMNYSSESIIYEFDDESAFDEYLEKVINLFKTGSH